MCLTSVFVFLWKCIMHACVLGLGNGRIYWQSVIGRVDLIVVFWEIFTSRVSEKVVLMTHNVLGTTKQYVLSKVVFITKVFIHRIKME